jgi:predicted ATPase
MLIVDEPEVHLHPRWIVEYARVLVLIQKYLHTTILIASHNPDMISAIKYISEKESISDSLAFYIAEEIDSDGFGKYKFKNLGTDIEEIFSSFNIALDRINLYGAIDAE